MDINQLHMFLEIVKWGSFQKTADENYISQRAISKQMGKLEDELEVKLFYRSHNKIVLTKTGYHFIDMAKKIIDTTDESIQELREISLANCDKLRIGFSSYIEASYVENDIAKYNFGNNISLYEESSEKLIADIINGYVDCGYTINYDLPKQLLINNKLNYNVVASNDIFMATSISNLLSNRGHIDVKDIEGKKLLYYSYEKSKYLEDYINAIFEPLRNHYTLVPVETIEKLQLLVSINKGIAICSGSARSRLSEDRNLVLLPLLKNNNFLKYKVILIYRKKNNQNMLFPFLRRILN